MRHLIVIGGVEFESRFNGQRRIRLLQLDHVGSFVVHRCVPHEDAQLVEWVLTQRNWVKLDEPDSLDNYGGLHIALLRVHIREIPGEGGEMILLPEESYLEFPYMRDSW